MHRRGAKKWNREVIRKGETKGNIHESGHKVITKYELRTSTPVVQNNGRGHERRKK